MTETIPPAATEPLVLFTVAGSRWALPVRAMERVIQAVEISPRPGAPAVLLGTIDVAGETAPVYDLSRAGAGREIALEDLILLVRTRDGLAGLWADDVLGVVREAPAPEDARFQDPDEILTRQERQATGSR